MSCQLTQARKRSPVVKQQKAIVEKEGILARDKYEPGDFVSTDQFVCSTPGRLEGGYGREAKDN